MAEIQHFSPPHLIPGAGYQLKLCIKKSANKKSETIYHIIIYIVENIPNNCYENEMTCIEASKFSFGNISNLKVFTVDPYFWGMF